MKELAPVQPDMRRLLLFLAVGTCMAAEVPDSLDAARQLYSRTEYEAALQILAPVGPKSGSVYLLMGQCQYMQGDPKKASETLQKAVEIQPEKSDNWLWLGRAFGRRAETSSFITAPMYAKKARDAFEKSVALNPNNREAVGDLFEYYLEAPGLLGGGLDKAAEMAKRMASYDAAEYHWAQSRLAEKRKEFDTAEDQLRRAVDVAPRQVSRLIDLAKFLSKSGRYQESDAVFRKAQQIDPNAPKLLFAQASSYIRAGRNLDTARALLKRYLALPLTPDDPPRREAEQLLRSAS